MTLSKHTQKIIYIYIYAYKFVCACLGVYEIHKNRIKIETSRSCPQIMAALNCDAFRILII